MDAIRWSVGVAFALLPGVVGWIRGRRLVRHLDGPAFAERLEHHRIVGGRILAVCLVGAILAPPTHRWATTLLCLLSALLGSWPAHRRIHEETWGPVGYSVHWLRLLTVAFGPWLLVLFLPALHRAAGGGLAVPAAVAAGLWTWSTFLADASVRILGLERLRESGLVARLSAILDRTRGPAPSLWTGGPEGGRFVNGVAIPGRPPAVVLTRDLLEELDADEVDAIFAHEVAHVETFPTLPWRARQHGPSLLATLYLVFSPWLGARDLASWMNVGWTLLCFLTLVLLTVGTRTRETDADLRAAELTGKPRALIRALERLHARARLPRRTAAERERRQSHPSLHRRIQAIRAAWELDAEPSESAEPMGPVVAWGRTPGRVALLDHQSVALLTVPPEVERSASPTTLEAHARRRESVRYSELAELRLDMRAGRAPTLVARDPSGAGWTLPLEDAAVPQVERALERADLHLAPPDAGAVSAGVWTLLGRASGLLALLAGLLAGPRWALVLAGLVVSGLPSATALAVLAGTALVSAGTGWMAGTGGPIPLLLLGLAIVSGVQAARTAPGSDRTRDDGVPVAVALVGIALSTLLGIGVGGAGGTAMRAHLWARAAPVAGVLAGGLVAAALLRDRRMVRVAGALGAVVGLAVVGFATSGVRARSGDLLSATPPRLTVGEAAWTEVERHDAPVSLFSLTLAPGGQGVAGGHAEDAATASGSVGTWIWGAGGGTELGRGVAAWESADVLVLVDAAARRIHRHRLVDGVTTTVHLPDQAPAAPAVRIHPSGWRMLDAWPVSGEAVEWRGSAATAPTDSRRWQWPHAPDRQLQSVLLGNDGLLLVGTDWSGGTLPMLAPITALGWTGGYQPPGTTLLAGRDGRAALLGSTVHWLVCGAGPGEDGLCATQGRSTTEFWRLGPDGSEPLGRLPSPVSWVQPLREGMLAMRGFDAPLLFDAVRGDVVEVPTGDDGPRGPSWVTAADYRDGVLALAREDGSGTGASIVLYRR